MRENELHGRKRYVRTLDNVYVVWAQERKSDWKG